MRTIEHGVVEGGTTHPRLFGRRRQKRHVLVALAGAVALTVGGCGDSSATSEGSSDTTPVMPSAAGPPGTSLGDGFTVIDGTTLIGDPIPTGVAVVRNGQPIIDDGWTATSIVTGGDPTGIIDAYMREAAEVGLVEQPGTGCTSERGVAMCSGFARSPDVNEPRSVSVTFVRGRSEDVYSDHVVVRFSTIDLYWNYGGETYTQPGDAVPAPTEWPPLQSVGEPLGTAGETTHAVPVQEGSRLAGPPRLNLDDTTGGVVAILEVTDDPRAVLQTYVDHLDDLGVEGSPPEGLVIGDAQVTTAHSSEAGGDHFNFTLVERPGRPTWLAIEGSHD